MRLDSRHHQSVKRHGAEPRNARLQAGTSCTHKHKTRSTQPDPHPIAYTISFHQMSHYGSLSTLNRQFSKPLEPVFMDLHHHLPPPQNQQLHPRTPIQCHKHNTTTLHHHHRKKIPASPSNPTLLVLQTSSLPPTTPSTTSKPRSTARTQNQNALTYISTGTWSTSARPDRRLRSP